MSALIISVILFLFFLLISFIIGLPILYFFYKDLLEKYPYIIIILGFILPIFPLFIIYKLHVAPFAWILFLGIFIATDIYLLISHRLYIKSILNWKLFFPIILMFFTFLVFLSPVIKADIISIMGFNTDVFAHISTVLAYSSGKHVFSDYPGYHILLSFYYYIFPYENIISTFVLFNAFCISIFFLIVFFLGNVILNINSKIKLYTLYIISFVIAITPIVYWSIEDSYAPQIFGILSVPLLIGLSVYLIKEKFSLRSIIIWGLSAVILLASYPPAAISAFFLLLIYFLFQIRYIKRILLLIVITIILLIPFWQNVSDFVRGTTSSVSSHISTNPGIAGGMYQRLSLPSILSLMPIYRTYDGPDLLNPKRLIIYRNPSMIEIEKTVSILYILFIPFIIYLFWEDILILSLVIGGVLVSIFGYFHVSPYGDFKIASFDAFLLPMILFLSIWRCRDYFDKGIQYRILYKISIFMIVIFSVLSMFASFLLVIDTTHVVLSESNVFLLYNKISRTVPLKNKILFIDNNLNNGITFVSLMNKYVVNTMDNFIQTAPLKNNKFNGSFFINNNVTSNINLYKSLNSYNYIVISSYYIQSYFQYLIPLNFKLIGSYGGYYVFKRNFIPLGYKDLTKISATTGNNISFIINSASHVLVENITSKKEGLLVFPVYSFSNGTMYIGENKYYLNSGFNLIKVNNFNGRLSIYNDSSLPIEIPYTEIVSPSQQKYIPIYYNSTLALYKSFNIAYPIPSVIGIRVGDGADLAYLSNFGRSYSFGANNTYRFIKFNSSIVVSINGSFRYMQVKMYLGMYGLSNRSSDINIYNSLCPDIYTTGFSYNDYTKIIQFNVPKVCINNNILSLEFNINSIGNQILLTQIFIKKVGV